jgi:hypothetical protein
MNARTYELDVLMAHRRLTTKLSHPGPKDKNRDSGIESANPGWLQHIVRLHVSSAISKHPHAALVSSSPEPDHAHSLAKMRYADVGANGITNQKVIPIKQQRAATKQRQTNASQIQAKLILASRTAKQSKKVFFFS